MSGKPNNEEIKKLWHAVRTLNDEQAHQRSIAQRMSDLAAEQTAANAKAVAARDTIAKFLEAMDIRPGSGNFGIEARTLAFLQMTQELFQQDYVQGMAHARSGEYRPSSLDARPVSAPLRVGRCDHEIHEPGCPACVATQHEHAQFCANPDPSAS